MRVRQSAVLGLFQQLIESFLKLFINFFNFFLIVPMQSLFLQVKFIALNNKLFKTVKDVLFNESKIAVEFFMMDVFLNFVVKADPLND